MYHTSGKEIVERLKKRVEAGDAVAIYQLGREYYDGGMGLPQDSGKALELWLQAGELGFSASNCSVGDAYNTGDGVEKDEKKAKHYWKFAAMGGDLGARRKLGEMEGNAGNVTRAMKHYMVSAGAGCVESMVLVCHGLKDGHVTSDDFMKTMDAHKEAVDEVKSDQREAAATKHKIDLKRDEALFKEPDPKEECPICMLPLPLFQHESTYQPCCGKTLCNGCIDAVAAENRPPCPFCRAPFPTFEELMARNSKRVEGVDAEAIYNEACHYRWGDQGFPQDYDKAMELWLRAGELGSAAAYNNIGNAYFDGNVDGVEQDMTKAGYYWELARGPTLAFLK